MARFGPGTHRIERRGGDEAVERLREFRELRADLIHDGLVDAFGEKTPREAFQCVGLFADGVAAVLQEMVMEVDFDGAGGSAGSAEAAGATEVLPILQAAQMRCDDAADGALISGAVADAADVFEDGAHIQTCAAADVKIITRLCAVSINI